MKKKLKIKIFADGADEASMLKLSKMKNIKGLTTNPSLMKKAGVKDYLKFSKKILSKIKHKSISLEIFSDEEREIERQARLIASLGKNVYVKIPIMNTKGHYLYELIKKLSYEGMNLNITAVFTLNQIKKLLKSLNPESNAYISIFSGRIADTGVNPCPIIIKTKKLIKNNSKIKVLWASTRELYNIIEANNIGCDIITVGHDLINKFKLFDYNLEKYSQDTVKQFFEDAKKSKYNI